MTFIRVLIAVVYFYIQISVIISEECEDDHRFCKFWASEQECHKNPDWMLVHCRLSCRICRVVPIRDTPRTVPFLPQQQKSTKSNRESFNISSGRCPLVQIREIETRFVVTPSEFRTIIKNEGCGIPNQPNDCERNMCYHLKFRTFDGSCNNFRHPTWGVSFGPLIRLASANYEDGVRRMIGSTSGTRPNPRDVTHFLLSSKASIPTRKNSLLMQFGQFWSHDASRNPTKPFCTCEMRSPLCVSVRVSMQDPKSMQSPCIPFTRAGHMCGTGVNGITNVLLNENSAYIDASNIYGSDPTTRETLRVGAFMKTSIIGGRVFPPTQNNSMDTGDDRSNLFVGLAVLHTTFIRMHNRFAAVLQNINPHWSPDRIYQETRKIIGAYLQVIVYKEYLPALLGKKVTLIPEYTGYKPEVNAGIASEFTAAAFRLHGLIQEFYPLVDPLFRKVGQVRFVEGTAQVKLLLAEGTDTLIRGLIALPARKLQRITTQLTEEFFEHTDMSTINILRGRDHGLRTYNDYRSMCNLPRIRSFNDWPEVSDELVRQRVSELYSDPENLDLYVGGVLEEPDDKSLVGSTFACIIADQFRRLRDGDRFYFANPGVFTPAQVASFSRVGLASVICLTGENYSEIPLNIFDIDMGQSVVPCKQIPQLNLNLWRETSDD